MGKNQQPSRFYPVRLSFGTKEAIKNFPDAQKLKKFMTAIPTLQKNIEGDSLSAKESPKLTI